MITVSIKKRDEQGKWNAVGQELAGKTMLQFFQEAMGQEIVAEVNLHGRRLFFCGTDHWLERMKQKGEAVMFDYAIRKLKTKGPQLLTEKIPHIACEAAEIFEGDITEHNILAQEGKP